MKHIEEKQLKKCIMKEWNEFQNDITQVFGNVVVDYEPATDEVFFNDGSEDLDTEKVTLEMSEYYGVKVLGFFLTGVEPTYIWIVYV